MSASTYVLRLFNEADPFHPIDSRALGQGELTIGRAAPGGWSIEDPQRALSRRHCVLKADDAGLTLIDTSANGVFLGPKRERAPMGEPVPVAPGDNLRLASFIIAIEQAPEPLEATRIGPGAGRGSELDSPFHQPILKPFAPDAQSVAVPTDWAAGEAPATGAQAPTEGSLLEAFCAGAGLDASLFAGEDPAEAMRRLGEVYRQMVLGLGDLMGERTSVKSEYRMARTAVGAVGNNPFKWAPPQRVAADLLKDRTEGFLTGPTAVKASFEDLKTHLACMVAGMRAAVAAALDELDPVRIDSDLAGGFLLKSRGAAAWTRYQALHRALRRSAADDPDNPVNAAFREAYEAALHELDSGG